MKRDWSGPPLRSVSGPPLIKIPGSANDLYILIYLGTVDIDVWLLMAPPPFVDLSFPVFVGSHINEIQLMLNIK